MVPYGRVRTTAISQLSATLLPTAALPRTGSVSFAYIIRHSPAQKKTIVYARTLRGRQAAEPKRGLAGGLY